MIVFDEKVKGNLLFYYDWLFYTFKMKEPSFKRKETDGVKL